MINKAFFAGILTILFSFLTVPVFAQNKDDYPNLGVGVVLGASFDFLSGANIGKTVSNVPASLRTVPSHPGDSWIYGSRIVPRVIPFDSIQPTPVNFIHSFFVGPELTFNRLRLRGGLNFSIIKDSESGRTKSNTGATREVNQSGKPQRGFGTSLVYYNMYTEPSRVPGFFSEVSVNLVRNVSLLGGFGSKNFDLMIESGYDRFDSLEKYKEYKAGTVKVWRAYGGIEFEIPIAPKKGDTQLGLGGIQLLAGKMPGSLTANGMSLTTDRQWFVTLSLALHVSTK